MALNLHWWNILNRQHKTSSLMHALRAFYTLCRSRKNPYPPHGRSLEIPRGRGGVLEAKFLEAMYENKLEFPGGGGESKQKAFHGVSMDIFWNCTLYNNFFEWIGDSYVDQQQIIN